MSTCIHDPCTQTDDIHTYTHLCNLEFLAQIFIHYNESNYTFIGLVLQLITMLAETSTLITYLLTYICLCVHTLFNNVCTHKQICYYLYTHIHNSNR